MEKHCFLVCSPRLLFNQLSYAAQAPRDDGIHGGMSSPAPIISQDSPAQTWPQASRTWAILYLRLRQMILGCVKLTDKARTGAMSPGL